MSVVSCPLSVVYLWQLVILYVRFRSISGNNRQLTTDSFSALQPLTRIDRFGLARQKDFVVLFAPEDFEQTAGH